MSGVFFLLLLFMPTGSYVEQLLSDSLGGIAPKSKPQKLDEMPDAEIFSEFGAIEGYRQSFGSTEVRIYLMENASKAYGLYTFYRNPKADEPGFTLHGDLAPTMAKYTLGRWYVEVEGVRAKGIAEELYEKLNRHYRAHMSQEQLEAERKLPMVVRSLPFEGLKPRTIRYVLGPKALERLLGDSVSQYDFYPDSGSEFALAEYESDSGKGRLLLIEYHTPQQAKAAFERLKDYRRGSEFLVEREGNYVIELSGPVGKSVADAVEYNYTIKWLDYRQPGPSWASEAAKTAQILVSVVSIIGIGLLVSVICGVGLGFVIFQIRRRRPSYAHTFSDAGGMIRLNIVDELVMERRQRQQ